jgi:hypothetical protein
MTLWLAEMLSTDAAEDSADVAAYPSGELDQQDDAAGAAEQGGAAWVGAEGNDHSTEHRNDHQAAAAAAGTERA